MSNDINEPSNTTASTTATTSSSTTSSSSASTNAASNDGASAAALHAAVTSSSAVSSDGTPNNVAPNVAASNATPTSPEAAATPESEVGVTQGLAAYKRISRLSRAIRESEQVRLNVEATSVTTTALGAVPRIKAMREEFVRIAPNYDLTLFDAFEDSVLAFDYIDAKVRATKREKLKLSSRAEAMTAVRDQLYDFAEGMAGYGLVNKAALKEVKNEPGYKPMLRDVSTLIVLIDQSWSQVGSKAPFTKEEMSKISDEALALRTAIGLQEQSPEGPRSEIIERRQVYTLFRRCVAEARKIAILLYGEDAVGDIVPAFFNAPGKSARKDDEETDAPEAPVAQPAPSAQQRPSGFVVNNPDNLPITSPFSEDDDDKKRSA